MIRGNFDRGSTRGWVLYLSVVTVPLIEYNVMRNCPDMLPDTEAAAGIWPWSCDNTLVQFNEVSGHKAPWDAQGFDSIGIARER